MQRLAGLLVLLALPAGVIAQEAGGLNNLSPDLMIVAEFDAAKGQLVVKMTQYREQEIQELSVGNGVTLKTTKVVGPYHENRYLDLKKCKVQEASGKAIAPTDFGKHFRAGTPVVVTNDGHPPAKGFMQLLRPETIIVVGPAVQIDPRIKLPPMPKKMPQ